MYGGIVWLSFPSVGCEHILRGDTTMLLEYYLFSGVKGRRNNFMGFQKKLDRGSNGAL